MKKAKLNFIIDAAMFFIMIVMVGIGFLIKYNLIPGKDRVVKYGRNVDLFLFGFDRHQWGMVHLVLGFILLGLLALHIILHWRFVVRIYQRSLNSSQFRKIIGFGFSIVCLALLFLPFFLQPEIQELGNGEGHSGLPRDHKSSEPVVSDDHFSGHGSNAINIAGFMTVGSICTKYNIPRAHLIEKLGLPENTTGDAKLGRLRQKYGFRMSDLEKIIENYHKKNIKINNP